MAWEHLSITAPHLVYIILGGFTSLFMLCSSVIKERLYIGEATVATLCGIIFGPHAADLINPLEWGNSDLITLEFARIVLVVQCFAVGVELPKSYMERHWKSVTLLLIPVMTWGWLITSLFIWWMFIDRLDWLDSLCVAACVTATDPVLASSVVGKGKFARRVPKHLRDLLSAESGCNDGMAFPFIYLAVYIIRYRPDTNKVSYYWFLYTVLYECIFGAFYGFAIGYIARRLIRYAHEKDLIDRESFLVFYFVLALFCAGSGSLLGMDDLLVGFACGVGFSNDGWFQEKTEEAHVSNVIDLLINLAFFVYFGAIIPWNQFNSDIIGTTPWRLVVIAILVLFFRRIPIMMALKPIIPDVKTWREALFAGHFGPIGVGGLFVAILARAELETESTTPLAVLPEPGFEHLNIIELIWPITVFLVITSILVHGSSIAVFTLGKHINTLTLTVSITQANEEGPSWMERLPRIQSRSKSQISLRKPDETDSSMDEKSEFPPGTLPPLGIPGLLRRQKEEDTPVKESRKSRKKKWDAGRGPGGPVSESAIHPSRSQEQSTTPPFTHQDSDAITAADDDSPSRTLSGDQQVKREPEEEVYEEGDKVVIEDEEGNVLAVRDEKGRTEQERRDDAQRDALKVAKEDQVEGGVARKVHKPDGEEPKSPDSHSRGWKDMRKRMEQKLRREEDGAAPKQAPKPEAKRGAARAYQFGNTIIVEDEDGEVIKKYDIPAPQRPQGERQGSIFDTTKTRQRLHRMGTLLGVAHEDEAQAGPSTEPQEKPDGKDSDDEHIRFTISAGGRRMSKVEFIQQIQRMDPKARAALVENSDAPEAVKREARLGAEEATEKSVPPIKVTAAGEEAELHHTGSSERAKGPEGLTLVDSKKQDIPFHSVSEDLAKFSFGGDGSSSNNTGETAAQRRRRAADQTAPSSGARSGAIPKPSSPILEDSSESDTDDEGPTSPKPKSHMDEGETAAERRRRLKALGMLRDDDEYDSSSSSSDDEAGTGTGMREPHIHSKRKKTASPTSPDSPEPPESPEQPAAPARAPGIRFADQSTPSQQQQQQTGASSTSTTSHAHSQSQSSTSGNSRLRWGENVGRGAKK